MTLHHQIILLSSVAISAGGAILFYAARRTGALVQALDSEGDKARWRTLMYLMYAFLGGYVATLFLLFQDWREATIVLVGAVFLLGSYFVLRTVEAGYASIRALEKLVEQRTKQAEFALESRTRFMANVSHEIRTPMNAVVGLTTLLLQSDLKPEQREDVLTLKQSGETLLRVVTDVLDFSKMESDNFVLANKPFNLDEVVDSTLKVWNPAAAAKEISLGFEKDDTWWSHWTGDGVRIQQMLHNLVANAIRFTDKGSVVIRGTCSGDEVSLAVADTGTGIKVEDQEQVFHSFRQSATDRGGTGLGLAIVHKICDAMKGEVNLESKLGEGSTFTLKLPLVRSDSTSSWEVSTLSDLDLSARVLLVDDNLVNLKVARRYLERLGCEVETAGDGQEALDTAKAKTYDLILMDCQMPVMDGLEATRLIRSDSKNRETTIYALTAMATPEDLEACTSSGMNGCLTKPIDLTKLKVLLLSLKSKRS